MYILESKSALQGPLAQCLRKKTWVVTGKHCHTVMVLLIYDEQLHHKSI